MTTSAPALFGAALPRCWNPWRATTNTVWRLGMSFKSLRSLRSSPTCRLSGIRLVTRTQHGMLYSSSNSISFGERDQVNLTRNKQIQNGEFGSRRRDTIQAPFTASDQNL